MTEKDSPVTFSWVTLIGTEPVFTSQTVPLAVLPKGTVPRLIKLDDATKGWRNRSVHNFSGAAENEGAETERSQRDKSCGYSSRTGPVSLTIAACNSHRPAPRCFGSGRVRI